jgi:sugar lactone lactonase YvrE
MLARSALALLCLSSACAHRAPAPPPAAPAPTWPEPPLAAKARLAGELPRDAAPAARPWWSRALSAVVGIDDRPARIGPLLVRPFGVTVRGDELLVADPDAAAVLRFDWRTGASRPIGCDEFPWAGPLAVAVDPEGAAYVADGGAGRLVRVGRDGGCRELGQGILERPSGVAWSAGRVYVVDPPRHAVVAFDADGRQIVRFGSRGEGDGELNYPTAISADADGTLLVVDALNFRIVRFSADGRHLSSFGQPGDVEGTFGRPKGVAATDTHIYVTDAQFDVVLVFDRAGTFEYVLGQPGAGPGELAMPAGVAVEGDHVFVASAQSGRIQIYELLREGS